VVVSAGDQPGELVPAGGEPVEDQQEVVGLEVGAGRFTARTALRGQLPGEVGLVVPPDALATDRVRSLCGKAGVAPPRVRFVGGRYRARVFRTWAATCS
jgi:hypothetical protein